MATANPTAKPVKSKTDQAIDYMKAEGVTAYAAAQKFGIGAAPIYKRLKLLASADRCPCCGQVIKGAE
jgi:hypothetical protein